jgi:hypothetical protein
MLLPPKWHHCALTRRARRVHQIVLAEELSRDPGEFDGRCVRVTGKVMAIDPRENTARLCDGVSVSLALAGPVKVTFLTLTNTPTPSFPRGHCVACSSRSPADVLNHKRQ